MSPERQRSTSGGLARMRARVRWLFRYGPKVVRLATFIAVLLVVASLLILHRAKAQLGDAMMALGPEMMRFDGADRVDRPRSLVLNGEELRFVSGTTRHAVDKVLDYYEAKCRQGDGGLADQFQSVMSDRLAVPASESSLLDPVMRKDDGHRGFVACLDMGRQSHTAHEVLARFKRFAESTNLSEVGDMRYVYAKKTDAGSHFVAFWSEGSLSLAKMFPASGDAPGKDLEDLPRPPESRRLLSSWEQGEPQGMSMYVSSTRDAKGLERFYRKELPKLGWTLLVDERIPQPAPMLVAERRGRAVTLVFGTDEQGHGTATVLSSP